MSEDDINSSNPGASKLLSINFSMPLPIDTAKNICGMIPIKVAKKKFLIINNNILENFFIKALSRKYIFTIFFIIFCFGWNPKTSLTGDIATNPLWKIPYNASKKVFGFESLRLFQDNPLIKWHKENIE